MTRLVTSPSANDELLEILTFIARNNPQKALEFIETLEQQIRKTLTTLPEAGKPHRNGTRYLTVMGRIIVYKYDKANDTVNILHYFGGGENWK